MTNTGIRSSGPDITEADREQLRHLEGVEDPTEWQRGQLHNLRIRSRSEADKSRTWGLLEKWNAKRAADLKTIGGRPGDDDGGARFLR